MRKSKTSSVQKKNSLCYENTNGSNRFNFSKIEISPFKAHWRNYVNEEILIVLQRPSYVYWVNTLICRVALVVELFCCVRIYVFIKISCQCDDMCVLRLIILNFCYKKTKMTPNAAKMRLFCITNAKRVKPTGINPFYRHGQTRFFLRNLLVHNFMILNKADLLKKYSVTVIFQKYHELFSCIFWLWYFLISI